MIRHLLDSIPYKKVDIELPKIPKAQRRPKDAREGLDGRPVCARQLLNAGAEPFQCHRVRNYSRDIFDGLTAGVVALPLCLAFGVASWLGAASGLYGGIILGLAASLLGGCRAGVWAD